MIERVCQHCGKTYQTFPSIKPKFCSSACSGAAKRTGEEKRCAVCGTPFWSYRSKPGIYCSKSCARTAANLTPANPAYSRDVSGEKNPMFGRVRAGPANPMYGKRREQCHRWKGGRKVRRDGYVLVVAPDDHPYPADQHKASGLKYILEHRAVMERRLGRYLLPEEVVHHRDGNPSNNEPDNLELFASQSDHISIGHGPG